MVIRSVSTIKHMTVKENFKKIDYGNYHIITAGNHYFYQEEDS